MSFLGLVSDKAPKNMEEIARLNWIIQEMERMNVVLRDERDIAKASAEGMIEHNKSRDKERNALFKQINKLKMEVMLEKKSSSGLTQKNGAMSIDLTMRKEERKVMMEEQIFSRKRVKEMEKQLNDDRSKRLRNIHENELLRRKNVDLESRCNMAEAAAQKAQTELLAKLQELDTALELVATQRRTIDAQGYEMLELNREVTMQKESMREMMDRCLRLERQLAERQKERDVFENEAFRLRREIMQIGASASEKATAFSSFEPRSRMGSAASSMRPNTTMHSGTSRGSSFRASSPEGMGRRLPPPGSAGSVSQSTFGTDSIFQRPEVDNGPLVTPAATPGDRRPRTRHISTAADPRANSMSPVNITPKSGSAATYQQRMSTAPPTITYEQEQPSEITTDPNLSIVTGETGEAGEEVDTYAVPELNNNNTCYNSASNNSTQRLDSPSAQSSPYPASPSPHGSSSSRKQQKNLTKTQKLAPVVSDLAASYLENTRTPGAGKDFSPHAKHGKGQHAYLGSGTGGGRSPGGGPQNSPHVKKQHLSDRSKAGFVGQGLGMRVEPLPPYSAGGGPKAVLARILAESESMD